MTQREKLSKILHKHVLCFENDGFFEKDKGVLINDILEAGFRDASYERFPDSIPDGNDYFRGWNDCRTRCMERIQSLEE